MKTNKEPLFEKLVSIENLEQAVINSAKKKTDRARVRNALKYKDCIVRKLRYLLINKKLRLPIHKGVDINDGISQKKRIIVKPHYVYELIFQWAIVQVLKPIMMKGMYKWSCGSITGRGALYGKRYLERYIKQNPKKIKYGVEADIYHFFESVDIELLKEMFKKKIRDKDMLWAINLVLDCNKIIYHGEEIDIGLPIGFYTSQWFANFYLEGLDHYIKEQLHMKCYLRYVDNLVLVGANKRELHKALFEISKYLAGIGLKLKGNYQVFRFSYTDKQGNEKGRAFDFMGYRFFRNKVIIRRKIFYKIMRKVRKVSRLKIIDVHSARQITCYMGYIKHTDSYKLFQERIKPLVNIGNCKRIVSGSDTRKEKRNAKATMERSAEQGTANGN